MNKKIEKQPHASASNFMNAVKCDAKTRAGGLCKVPAANGKKRCRMHGGAKSSGAPVGNKNAFKHGACGREIKAMKEILKKLIRNPSQDLEDKLHMMLQREINKQS